MTPRLIWPAPLHIEKLIRGGAPENTNARELVGDAERVEYVIPAQRGNAIRHLPGFSQEGNDSEISCWFVVRIVDAKRINYTPGRGDRVTKHGKWNEELYVQVIEPAGHYSDGPTLLRLYCADRAPAMAPSNQVSAW